MTFLDSSVIIDYLNGEGTVVNFVDDQAVLRTSSVCVYEVFAGEVFSEGDTDLEGVRDAFGRVSAVEFSEDLAFEAARIQDHLLQSGTPMSPRDVFIAATARSTGDELVVSDADFDTDELHELMPIRML